MSLQVTVGMEIASPTLRHSNLLDRVAVLEVDHPQEQWKKRCRIRYGGLSVASRNHLVTANLSEIPLENTLAVSPLISSEKRSRPSLLCPIQRRPPLDPPWPSCSRTLESSPANRWTELRPLRAGTGQWWVSRLDRKGFSPQGPKFPNQGTCSHYHGGRRCAAALHGTPAARGDAVSRLIVGRPAT